MLTFLESLPPPPEEDDTEILFFFPTTDSEELFFISAEDGFPEIRSLFVLPLSPPPPPPPPRSRFMLTLLLPSLPSLEETEPLRLPLSRPAIAIGAADNAFDFSLPSVEAAFDDGPRRFSNFVEF